MACLSRSASKLFSMLLGFLSVQTVVLRKKNPKKQNPQQSTFIKAISLKRKYSNDVLIAKFYIQFYIEEQNWYLICNLLAITHAVCHLLLFFIYSQINFFFFLLIRNMEKKEIVKKSSVTNKHELWT